MYHDRANDWATITADLPPRENSTPSLTLEGSPCKQNRPRTVLHGRFGERLLTSDESPLGEATATTDSSGESASFRSAVCGSSDFDGHFGRGHLPFELPSLCFSPCQRFRNGESRPALGWSFLSSNLYVIKDNIAYKDLSDIWSGHMRPVTCTDCDYPSLTASGGTGASDCVEIRQA